MTRFPLLLVLLTACQPELTQRFSAELPDDVRVTGTLPADTDLDAVLADLPEGSMALVGDASTGDIAVVQRGDTLRSTSPGAAAFAVERVECIDCVNVDCGTVEGSLTRTVELDLRPTSAAPYQQHTSATLRSENFSMPSTPSWIPVDGAASTVSLSGTVDSCGPFSVFIDAEPDADYELAGQWAFEAPDPFAESTGNWDSLQVVGGSPSFDGSQVHVAAGTVLRSGNYTGPTIADKTLMSWVRIDDLNVRAGSPMALDHVTVDRFDSIVWAEATPLRWLAGSTSFQRTNPSAVTIDDTDTANFRQMAISYRQITGGLEVLICKDGQQIGYYVDNGPFATWAAGEAEALFGPRHTNPGAQGSIDATIEESRIYHGFMTCDQAAAETF